MFEQKPFANCFFLVNKVMYYFFSHISCCQNLAAICTALLSSQTAMSVPVLPYPPKPPYHLFRNSHDYVFLPSLPCCQILKRIHETPILLTDAEIFVSACVKNVFFKPPPPPHSSAVQCSAVWCSAMQCNAVQNSAEQCSTVHYSSVQCSVLLCSHCRMLTVNSRCHYIEAYNKIKRLLLLLPDSGEARGCSINSIVIN